MALNKAQIQISTYFEVEVKFFHVSKIEIRKLLPRLRTRFYRSFEMECICYDSNPIFQKVYENRNVQGSVPFSLYFPLGKR